MRQSLAPENGPVTAAAAFMESAKGYDLKLIASLQPGAPVAQGGAGPVPRHSRRAPADVLWLVGPEGDFTPAEMSRAKVQRVRAHHARPARPAVRDRGGVRPHRAQLRARRLTAGRHHTSRPPAKVRPAPTLQKMILSPSAKIPSSAAHPRAIDTLAALVLPYLAIVITNFS